RLSSKSNWAKRIFRLHTLKLMHTIPTTTPTRGTKAISATATSQGLAEKISSMVPSPTGEGTSEYSPATADSCADPGTPGRGGDYSTRLLPPVAPETPRPTTPPPNAKDQRPADRRVRCIASLGP